MVNRLESELRAGREIQSHLSSLFTLVDELDFLLERAINAHAETAAQTPAAKVCLILATRLANDIRVCSIASRQGYGLQGLGLVATVVELLGALSYIAASDDRAVAWAEHSNRRKSYPPLRDGISAALTTLGLTESAARDAWTREIERICMAKHANPMLSLEQGLRILPDGAYFVHGPDSSELGIKMCFLALYHAVGFGTGAVFVFSQLCPDARVQAQLREDALRIRDELRRLVPTPPRFEAE